MFIEDFALKMIFCNDGVLKFEINRENKKTLIPVDFFLQIMFNNKNLSLNFLKMLKKNIYIQDGTTLGDILLALEPWKQEISFYVSKDVSSYIDEVKKIFLVDDENVEKYKGSRIDIQCIDILSRRTEEYYKDNGEQVKCFFDLDDRETVKKDLNIFTNFNKPQHHFNMYKGEDPQNYGIPKLSISKSFPVYINPNCFILSNKNENLFNNENTAIYNQDSFSFIIYNNIESNITFEDFLDSMFNNGFFFNSPKEKEEIENSLKERLKNTDVVLREKRDGDDSKITITDDALIDISSFIENEFSIIDACVEVCKKTDMSKVESGIKSLEEGKNDYNNVLNMIFKNK